MAQWYSGGLWCGRSGVWVPAGAGSFSVHHHVWPGSGAHPAFYPIPGAVSLWVKQPGYEAYCSPGCAEVKNAWSYISTPPICLHGVLLS